MRVAMVPLLPCTSIDAMAEFWVLLGIEVSYRPMRSNPYLALEREGGFVLHHFALDGFGAGSGNAQSAGGPLARALDNAVVLADSHGDDAQEFLRELDSRLEE